MSLRSAFVSAAIALAAGGAAASVPEKQVVRTLPLVTGSLSVEAYKGSIHVRTWDRAEVSVAARVVADDSCDHDLARGVEKTEVVVSPVAGGVTVRADYDHVPGRLFGCSALPFVHFEISMPRSAPLRVKDYKSAIHVAPLEGDLKLETYKGTVELEGVGGALDLETYKGEVRAATELRRDTRIETYKGSVTLSVPKGAPYTLDANLGHHAHLEADVPLAARAGRGDVRTHEAVHGGGPLLALTSHKGAIRLRER